MINQFTPIIKHFSAVVMVDKFTDSLEFIVNLGKNIANGLNLTIVKRVENKFEPAGRTLVYILSESHLAIHTWPEYGMLHIDLLSCAGTKIIDYDRVLASALKDIKITEYKSKSHTV